MKRQILTLGAICAAAFTLTNCNKEIAEPEAPVTEGIPFEIVAATADTKTANDGLNTVWTTGDALNVFHAEAGSIDYGTNDEFTYAGSANKFTGKLTTGLGGGKKYDWYALYPYNKNIKTPAGSKTGDGWAYIGHKGGATQNGYNSKAHLAENLCPLYGVAESIDASTPVSFNMKHIASVVKIVVTNENESPLTVNSITFTAPEDIVGSYFMNFTDPNNVVCKASETSYVSSTATLNVTGGTALNKGEKAEFYIPIKPFKAAANKLKITVNGYEKTPVSTADVEFKAGKIETVNFKYNKPAPSGFATTYTSNVTMKAGDNSQAAEVIIGGTKYAAVKAGTKNGAGKLSIKIPAGTTKLHIHAAGWKGDASSFTIEGATVSDKTITPMSDDGVSGSGTSFTLKGDPTNYYKELTLTGVTAETTLTITATKASKCRFVIFGVNAE